jgi:hypothetical protein
VSRGSADIGAALLAFLLSVPAFGDEKSEKKEEKKPEPPRVVVTLPLAVSSGATNKIRIRGNNLTNISEIRFTNVLVQAEILITATTKADVPKEADVKKVGDTQIEVEIHFPPDACSTTNYFIVVTPDGESEPKPLIVMPATNLIDEREPNGGFKQAQEIVLSKTLIGSIKEANDVDVFRFKGQAGQQVVVEVAAASLGSGLDSVLTLYDATGHTLVTNDDSEDGKDSLIRARLPVDGSYLIGIMDAHDKGGPTYVYLLRVGLER